jgi:hypothetical protein
VKPEDLAAVDALEADSKRMHGQNPALMTRVQWLCTLVKRLDAPESVPDDRDAVLQTQAARIVELESRLGLSADAVLALERAQLKARTEKDEPKGKPEDKGQPNTDEQSERAVTLDLKPDLTPNTMTVHGSQSVNPGKL